MGWVKVTKDNEDKLLFDFDESTLDKGINDMAPQLLEWGVISPSDVQEKIAASSKPSVLQDEVTNE